MTDVNKVSNLFKNTNLNIAYQLSNTIHDLLTQKQNKYLTGGIQCMFINCKCI